MEQWRWEALSTKEKAHYIVEGWRVLDWIARVKVPIYLDAAGLVDQAKSLRALPTVTGETAVYTSKILLRIMNSHDPSLDRMVDWNDKTKPSDRHSDPVYWCMVRTENLRGHGIAADSGWIVAGCETLIKRAGKSLDEVEGLVVKSLVPLGYKEKI